MTNPHCMQCEIGLLHLNNHYALKEYKTIGRIEYIKKAQKLAANCFACIYNNQSERKGKRIRKVYANFKSVDMVIPIIKSKSDCPLCGYIVGGIIDNGFLYEYCLSDGCKFKQKTEVINVQQ